MSSSYLKTCETMPTLTRHFPQAMVRPSPRHTGCPGRDMVAIMNEGLELSPGLSVLEVGAGSGYHAATIAEIVASEESPKPGHVYTIESVPELADFARMNLKEAGYSDKVTVIQGDGSKGFSEETPYDRILVTAAAPDVPAPLIEQLKPGGIILIPLGGEHYYQDLVKVRKNLDGTLRRESLGAVAFVPLRGKYGWRE